jgi:hypothetical protein
LRDAVRDSRADWALYLREDTLRKNDPDPAFEGRDSYLNTEQGVRAVLSVANDLTFVRAEQLALDSWEPTVTSADTDEVSVSAELAELAHQEVSGFVDELAGLSAEFDWRGVNAHGLTDEQRALKRAFRGAGGYVEFRKQLLSHINRRASGDLKREAGELVRHIRPRK